MNKSTIIVCIIALVGIAYFDDIKNFFTGDRDEASLLLQQHMQQQQGSSPVGNSSGKTLLEMSSKGHFVGPYVNTPVEAVPIDIDDDDYPSRTTTGSSTHKARSRACNSCNGTGTCSNCNGHGLVSGFTRDRNVGCASCSWTGRCQSCNGTGNARM